MKRRRMVYRRRRARARRRVARHGGGVGGASDRGPGERTPEAADSLSGLSSRRAGIDAGRGRARTAPLLNAPSFTTAHLAHSIHERSLITRSPLNSVPGAPNKESPSGRSLPGARSRGRHESPRYRSQLERIDCARFRLIVTSNKFELFVVYDRRLWICRLSRG